MLFGVAAGHLHEGNVHRLVVDVLVGHCDSVQGSWFRVLS
jgi:hypothetical protein